MKVSLVILLPTLPIPPILSSFSLLRISSLNFLSLPLKPCTNQSSARLHHWAFFNSALSPSLPFTNEASFDVSYTSFPGSYLCACLSDALIVWNFQYASHIPFPSQSLTSLTLPPNTNPCQMLYLPQVNQRRESDEETASKTRPFKSHTLVSQGSLSELCYSDCKLCRAGIALTFVSYTAQSTLLVLT